jgi:hypothetical protein
MELQYVVQLDVRGKYANVDVRGEILRSVIYWLGEKTGLTMAQDFYLESGSEDVKVLSFNAPETTGKISWESISTDKFVAVRIVLSQAMTANKSNFLTSITIAEASSNVTQLRIALGRESNTEVLSPIEFAKVSPPKLLGSLLRNKKLKFRSLDQAVDAEFVTIKSNPAMEYLIEILKGRRSLPILLIDTVNAEKRYFAAQAVKALAGMVQVICLPASMYVTKFNREFPEYEIPFSGARLIWPDNEARHNNFSSMNLEDASRVVSQLKTILFKASAVVRNRDTFWSEANQRLRTFDSERQLAEFRVQLANATAAGDKDLQIEVLENRLSETEELLKLADEELKTYGSSDSQEESRSKIRALEAQVSHYRDLALKKPENIKLTFEDLKLMNGDDFTELFNGLELITGGALTFTPNARVQWDKDGRPEASKMRTTLVKMGQAAVEWRQLGTNVGQDLSLWLGAKIGLSVPMADAGLKRVKKNLFDFEGQTWDRSAHVKLKDNTSPDAVGRIYFDIDNDQERFIVDHVGLKLYGI